MTITWRGTVNYCNQKSKDENDEEIDEEDHDEVFDKTQPTRIKRDPQETSSRTQIELKIQDFARDWARTLKQSEYKTEIFRGLTQLGLMENRRNKLLSSFEVFFIIDRLNSESLRIFELKQWN